MGVDEVSHTERGVHHAAMYIFVTIFMLAILLYSVQSCKRTGLQAIFGVFPTAKLCRTSVT